MIFATHTCLACKESIGNLIMQLLSITYDFNGSIKRYKCVFFYVRVIWCQVLNRNLFLVLTLIVGYTFFSDVLVSPGILPADLPSHSYRNRKPLAFGCSEISTQGALVNGTLVVVCRPVCTLGLGRTVV